MGNFLGKQQESLIITGASGSGKTTFLDRTKNPEQKPIIGFCVEVITVANFQVSVLGMNQKFDRGELVETAGEYFLGKQFPESKFLPLLLNYYDNSSAIIFFIDASLFKDVYFRGQKVPENLPEHAVVFPKTLEETDLMEILMTCPECRFARMDVDTVFNNARLFDIIAFRKPPVLFILNKIDLVEQNARSSDEILQIAKKVVDLDRIKKTNRAADCNMMSVDSLKGKGITEAIEWLSEVCSKKRKSFALRLFEPYTQHQQQQPQQSIDGVDHTKIGEDDEYFLKCFENCTLPFTLWSHKNHVRLAWIVVKQEIQNKNLVIRDSEQQKQSQEGFVLVDQEALSEIFEKSLERIRAGIIKYNSFLSELGVSNKTSYHETLTRFWTSMVIYHCFICDQETGRNNNNSFSTSLPNTSELLDSRLFSKYYSRDYLFSAEARAGWKDPDLIALPFSSSLLPKANGIEEGAPVEHHSISIKLFKYCKN